MLFFGIIWWALLVDLAVLGGLFWLVHEEWPVPSIGWAIVFGGAALWLSGVDVIGAVASDPLGVLYAIVIYLVIGIVWSLVHWLLWVNSEETRDLIKARHIAWDREYNRPKVVGSDAPIVEPEVTFEKSEYYPFSWKSDFPRILTWVIWWPIDAVLYVLGDLTYNLATMVGHWFSGIYSGIARGVVNRVIPRP